MAIKVDIIAPQIEKNSSALTLTRWLKVIGNPVQLNEPVAEVSGAEARGYIHAPVEGTLSTIMVQPGQTFLSGALMGHIAVISKNAIDWTNFDQVTAILEDFADKSKTLSSLKDANEALGQLLGVSEEDIFRKMSIEHQNKFLQNVVDQHSQNGLSPAEVAQKLLEGLALRNPQVSGAAIRGPAATIGGMSPGGGFGGGAAQQQQPWQQQPTEQNALPPQQGWQLPPRDDDKK